MISLIVLVLHESSIVFLVWLTPQEDTSEEITQVLPDEDDSSTENSVPELMARRPIIVSDSDSDSDDDSLSGPHFHPIRATQDSHPTKIRLVSSLPDDPDHNNDELSLPSLIDDQPHPHEFPVAPLPHELQEPDFSSTDSGGSSRSLPTAHDESSPTCIIDQTMNKHSRLFLKTFWPTAS